jgi:hypothetical protein
MAWTVEPLRSLARLEFTVKLGKNYCPEAIQKIGYELRVK